MGWREKLFLLRNRTIFRRFENLRRLEHTETQITSTLDSRGVEDPDKYENVQTDKVSCYAVTYGFPPTIQMSTASHRV